MTQALEALTHDLLAIGFTEYEARVYLALLRKHPATGYQIGKQAGIPRSMVYEALGRLHTRGAVLKADEQGAALYRPLPPDVLLQRHDQQHQRQMERLSKGLSELYAARDETRLWAISGRGTVLSYAARMIQEAASELWLVLTDRNLDELREAIGQADARGVRISTLLTGSEALAHGRVVYHPPLESELQELTDALVVVVDRNEALIGSGAEEITATVTNNRDLVLIARQFVWMELFTQRIYARLDGDLLARLDPEDRAIFESFPGAPPPAGTPDG